MFLVYANPFVSLKALLFIFFYQIYSEPLLNQDDTTEVEIPLSHGAVEKEEGKEEEGGGGKTTYNIV